MLLFFHIGFQFFASSLLLPTPPWWECLYAWSSPRGSLYYPNLLDYCLLFWWGVFWFLIFQITDLSLSFIFSTVDFLYIILHFSECILHFQLFLFYDFNILFCAVEVLSSLNILIIIVLNSVSFSLLASFSFNSCSFTWYLFLCLLLWLLPYVCFYVLSGAAKSSRLGSRYSVGPSGSSPKWSIPGIPNPPCGLCTPSCYSWALAAVGTSMGGIYPQAEWLWGLTAIMVEV